MQGSEAAATPSIWKVTIDREIGVGDVAEKVDLLHRQLASVPFAESPALLGVDEPTRTIDVQWLELGPTLGQALDEALRANNVDLAALFLSVAAQTLATIHALGCDGGGPCPQGMVFIHGDFGFSNIFVKQTTPPMLQILDPLPRDQVVDIRCAAPEVDVAMMLSCLLGRPPLAPWRHRRDRRRLEGHFVGEYQRLTGRRLVGLRQQTRQVLMATCARHRALGRLLRRVGLALLVLEIRHEYPAR